MLSRKNISSSFVPLWRFYAALTFTLRQKILGLAFLLLFLSSAVIICMRMEVVAYSERDSMRSVSVALLNAHRFERDFLTTRSAKEQQQFQAAMQRIDSLLTMSNAEQMQTLQASIHHYTATFHELSRIIEQRGINENTGAEGSFRKSVHAMENLINANNELHLMNLMLQIRRHEKDFIMRRKPKYVAEVEHTLGELRTATTRTGIAPAQAQQIVALSGVYHQNFLSLVTLFVRIDSLDNRLTTSFLAINTHLESIVDEKERIASAYRNVSLGVIVFALMLGIGIALRMSQNISAPIVVLSAAARKVAKGDFSIKVETQTRDEIRHLGNAFNQMTDSIRTTTTALHEEKHSVEQKVREATATIEQERSSLAANVAHLVQGIEHFAQGDLTTRFAANDASEIAHVYRSFNQALTNIQELLLSTNEAVVEAAQAGVIIAEKSQTFAAGAEQQSKSAATAARSVEEMMQGIATTLDNINAATLYAQHASQNARKGVETVEHTASGINAIVVATRTMQAQILRLTERIEKIDEIAGTIKEIADQTNLLSLNASIEAARAGEQGRGFAVVADEVKKLADRTTAATKEITQTVNGIHQETKDTNTVMQEARSTVAKGIELTHSITYMFEEILNDSLQVSGAMAEIQHQSHAHRTMSEQVNADVQDIAAVVVDAETDVRRLAEVADELKSSMSTIYNLLQNFTLSTMQQIEHELGRSFFEKNAESNADHTPANTPSEAIAQRPHLRKNFPASPQKFLNQNLVQRIQNEPQMLAQAQFEQFGQHIHNVILPKQRRSRYAIVYAEHHETMYE
ncbi:MAG: HAMP domain-containing protein [Candidatus Kapaibacterium sp.]|nr:MAG: HAMP domain-containing protein [Candidatus Kapabacteria bacterium]